MKTKTAFFGRISDGIENVRQTPVVKAINGFMASPWGVGLIALLTVLAHITATEIVLYTLVLAYCLYVCVLGEDFLTLAPLCVFCYIAPSRANNPGQNDASIFSGSTGIFLLVGVGVLLVFFLVRVALDPKMGFGRLFKCKRVLLIGMLAMGVAYLLSGMNSEHYDEIWGKNMMFALLQFVAVFILYFLLTALVDWNRERMGYLMWIGFLAGCVIAIEVIHLYIMHFDDFFLNLGVNDRWNRWQIYLGWGMHNNIGAMLALTTPFACCLACRSKHGYLFVLPSVAIVVALFMTLSRTSILAGIAIYTMSFVIMLFKAWRQKLLLLLSGGVLAVGAIALKIYWNDLISVMTDIFSNGFFDASGRGALYKAGLAVFKENPVFGEGFYPADMTTFQSAYWLINSEMTSFFPPRWHNTIIQLLASCGVVGVVAYFVHRVQTVWLFLRGLTVEKLFIGFSVAAFLGMSLLDNHFFNLGPVLFYSIIMAFVEKGVPARVEAEEPEEAPVAEDTVAEM